MANLVCSTIEGVPGLDAFSSILAIWVGKILNFTANLSLFVLDVDLYWFESLLFHLLYIIVRFNLNYIYRVEYELGFRARRQVRSFCAAKSLNEKHCQAMSIGS